MQIIDLLKLIEQPESSMDRLESTHFKPMVQGVDEKLTASSRTQKEIWL